MSLHRIAIVGRPNVGKSSLLNMLAKARVAIVDPTPGVTRDRLSIVASLDAPQGEGPNKMAEITDTGGYGVYTAEDQRFDDVGEDLSKLSGPIEAQIAAAVGRSDLILFVLDAQSGVTPLDETIAGILRKRAADAKILAIANKTDGPRWEAHAFELSSLGFGVPVLVSAKNNYMRRGFLDALYTALPREAPDRGDESEAEMKIAIVGKRNAGKSTYVNALAGEDRVITSEIAGTTRDAIDVRFELDGRSLVAIDTAGLRKRKSMPGRIEWWAQERALASVARADVTLLMIDATEPISRVDKNLGAEISERFKPCVIVVNKWDLAEGRPNKHGRPVNTGDYAAYIEKELRGLTHAPIVFTSALTGEGIRRAIDIAFLLRRQSHERVGTGRLNRIFKDMVTMRGPSSRLGTQAKVLYATQVAVAPPTIVVVVNHAELFTPEYQRYMLNRLAEQTPFNEIPVRLIIRDRKRADLDDLISGEHRRRRLEQAAGDEPLTEEEIAEMDILSGVETDMFEDESL
ncbi:MAG: ribosome biogenesis GTPase Der [Phycisphaeraceae bacterium]|nr:ribosome biogenesis GTPase Der [Phycisphaeraceae bacterium]